MPVSLGWPVRILEAVCASLLLLLAMPLMAALALAVRLTSSGAVLQREPAAGRRGRTYERLSFRTTLDGASSPAHAQIREAIFGHATPPPRTRLGQLMCATRADRLPQLFNVLAGDSALLR